MKESILTIPVAQMRLPKDWCLTTLGDACDFLDSKRKPVNNSVREHRIAGKSKSELYPYYGANGQVGWIDDFIFDESLILLAEDGGPFGSTEKPISYPVSGKCWVNNHAHVLRPRAMMDFDFCTFALSIRPDVGNMVTGSTRPKLNQETATKILIPLPPLPTQRRIAAQLKEQLAEVDRARTALQVQLDAAKALPAAALRTEFGKATSDNLSTGAGELPSNWRWSKLEEECALLPSKSIQSHGDAIVSAITSACLTETGFDVKGLKVARMALTQVQECKVSNGEVLVARSNTPELVGRVALFNGEVEDIVASDLTIRLWPHERVMGGFLAAFLSFLFVSGYWRERASGASGTMKKITRSQIQQLLIPTPPLSTQKAIVIRLRSEISEAARLRAALETKLATLDRLPSALLRQVFGEVSSGNN